MANHMMKCRVFQRFAGLLDRYCKLEKFTFKKQKRQYGQANRGLWRMPGSCEAKKAVISCEKPGGGAHIQRYPDSRMG